MTIFAKMSLAAVTCLAATTMTLTFPDASAMAEDAASAYQVKTTTDGRIRLAVKAFKKDDFEKSIRLNQAALDSNLSPKKAAIAHNNICASYAELGQVKEAKAACATALELRSDYAPAKQNKAKLAKAKRVKK